MRRLARIITILWVFGWMGAPIISYAEGMEEANQAYGQQDYAKAIELYEAILASGQTAPALHYNIGNAYFKSGQLGKSILHYEKTLRIDPSHKDAQFNLELANGQIKDRIEQIPTFFLTSWFGDVYRGTSAGQWALVAIVLIWLALFSGIFMRTQSSLKQKRLGFIMGIVLGIMGVVFTIVSLSRKQDIGLSREAVVVASSTFVKDAPNGQSDLIQLHEGSKVKLLQTLGDWTQIEISGVVIGEVKGFILSQDLGSI